MTGPLDDLLGPAGPPPAWRPTGPVRFSIVVRTQGRRPGSLAEAIDSLAAQTHPAHEVLVVVHSTDRHVLSMVDENLNRLHPDLPIKTLQATGGGRSRPLNIGLDTATGDYVCFLDDDDLAHSDWLGKFDAAIQLEPGTTVRARTGVQTWTTDGSEEPRHPIGPIEEPFAPQFDLLAHVSHNETPICSVALPRHLIEHLSIRFDEELPVFEDWDFLMAIAPISGVRSIDAQTSLYRRLDHGNADSAESEEVWHRTHPLVVAKIASRPLLLPAGDAQRIAATHFVPGRGSRYESELAEAQAELAQLTWSPIRWIRAFAGRVRGAAMARISERRQ